LNALSFKAASEVKAGPYPPGSQEAEFPTEPEELGAGSPLLRMVADDPWEEALAPVVDGFICQALRQLGVFRLKGEVHSPATLIVRYGVLPVYRPLLEQWLTRLTGLNLLACQGPFFSNQEPLPDIKVAPTLAEFKARLPQHLAILEYIERCGNALAEVIQGRLNPVQLLFPDGSFEVAEAIYKDLPIPLYFNRLASWAMGILLDNIPAERPISILEVGAGSGSTTEQLLPTLTGREVSYLYTDLSGLFLRRGKQKFEQYPFIRFELLDIGRSAQEQGFEPESFDFIVATNVLHVTPGVKDALRHIRNLLKPEGWLLLNETNLRLDWLDMTMALFPEWQLASLDPTRQGHPFLSASRWAELLVEAGFNPLKILPSFDTGPQQLRQHLLLAS
jgi:polyketide synthase PksM